MYASELKHLPLQLVTLQHALQDIFAPEEDKKGVVTRRKVNDKPDTTFTSFGLITIGASVTGQQGHHIDNARDWPNKVKDVEVYGNDSIGIDTDFQQIHSFRQLGYSCFIGLSAYNSITFAESDHAKRILGKETTVVFDEGDALIFCDYSPHTGDAHRGPNEENNYKLFTAINARTGNSMNSQRWFDLSPDQYWLRYSPRNVVAIEKKSFKKIGRKRVK